LIDEIGTIDPSDYYFDEVKGLIASDSDSVDAFEAAEEYYNTLSDKQKAKVTNYDLLEGERENYQQATANLEKCKIFYAIYSKTEYTFIRQIKRQLKNQSSFEEYGFLTNGLDMDSEKINLDTGEFEFYAFLSYSATNSFGGRMDEKLWATVTGVYKDGEVATLNIQY
jgi:hypothetical protein